MGKRFTVLMISILVAVVVEALVVVVFNATGGIQGDSMINRLAELLGGNIMAGGYVQAMEYVAFVWGLLEINATNKVLKKEMSYLDYEVLPGGDYTVIGSNEVNQIRVKVTNYIQQKKDEYPDLDFFLLNMIKRVTTKFGASSSVAEAMEIVSSQSQINLLKAESNQTAIRYTAWVIPTIGFIGTVLGISSALSIADSGDTNLITSTLGVAFDTTLVALIISVPLMWSINKLQEHTERLHTSIQEYVIENLINRINVY